MKAIVNKDKCFGCGSCVASMDKIFAFDDDGKATVITDEVAEEDKEELVSFVDKSYCPGDAISYEK